MERRPGLGLSVIRLAMSAGLLTFGVGAWFASRARAADAPPPPPTLQWVAWGVFGTALAALVAWRLLRSRQLERGDATTCIVAWAIGEVPALFGAAYLVLTGQPGLLVAGYAVFASALVLFPAPRT